MDLVKNFPFRPDSFAIMETGLPQREQSTAFVTNTLARLKTDAAKKDSNPAIVSFALAKPPSESGEQLN